MLQLKLNASYVTCCTVLFLGASHLGNKHLHERVSNLRTERALRRPFRPACSYRNHLLSLPRTLRSSQARASAHLFPRHADVSAFGLRVSGADPRGIHWRGGRDRGCGDAAGEAREQHRLPQRLSASERTARQAVPEGMALALCLLRGRRTEYVSAACELRREAGPLPPAGYAARARG